MDSSSSTPIASSSNANGKGNNNNNGKEKDNDNDNDNDDECCAICFDSLKQPISLPCKHRFCTSCLNQWRSKYNIGDNTKKTCPICRSKIPVTKEMISKLNMYGIMIQFLKDTLTKGRPYPPPPQPYYGKIFNNEEESRRFALLPAELQQHMLKQRLEQQVQIYTAIIQKGTQEMGVDHTNVHRGVEVLEENTELACDELPEALSKAALTNNVEVVMDWLGVGVGSGDSGSGDYTDFKWKHPNHQRTKSSQNNENENKEQKQQPIIVTPIIPHKKINAMNHGGKASRTLLHEAAYNCNFHLMRFLLQYGATVDPLDAVQVTPLLDACSMVGGDHVHGPCTGREHAAVVLLLLEWGANKEVRMHGNNNGGKSPLELCSQQQQNHEKHNKQLVNLLGSELGGRRCTIVGLKSRSDLNGKTCVVVNYFKNTKRYDVRVSEHPDIRIRGRARSNINNNSNNEHTDDDDNGDDLLQDECVNVKSSNLRRRDRTPNDPGMVVNFDGRNPETNNTQWELRVFDTTIATTTN